VALTSDEDLVSCTHRLDTREHDNRRVSTMAAFWPTYHVFSLRCARSDRVGKIGQPREKILLVSQRRQLTADNNTINEL
jgi:hypothetical protein